MGVVTDVNGVYKLELPTTAKALLFSFVGMKTKEVELKDQSTINVVLEEEISDLDEVTVVAYGERKKRELIGAVSSVKAKDLEEIPSASLENLLQGHMRCQIFPVLLVVVELVLIFGVIIRYCQNRRQMELLCT